MLTRLDDYLVHQTPEPLAHPSSGDRNFYDRHWFNGYGVDGAPYFGVALGLYPNRRVMDGAMSVVHDGRQHVVRASRLAPRERTETSVAPIRVEVIEPLRTLRVVVEPNDWGIEADLVFRARTPALEEPRLVRREGTRIVMDSTRATQFGDWEGSLTVAGERLEVAPGSLLGTRDRSWGVRPVGEREGAAPAAADPQFFFLWAPLRFPGRCVLFQVNEDSEGRAWHANGVVTPLVDGSADALESASARIETLASVGHDVRWRKGTRHAERARLVLVPAVGACAAIDLEPLLRFQMRGLGYLDPEWGHGVWKGDHAVSGDCWLLDELDVMDPRHVHVQQLCRARWDGEEGVGILEQLVIGRHVPSGFHGLLDAAP